MKQIILCVGVGVALSFSGVADTASAQDTDQAHERSIQVASLEVCVCDYITPSRVAASPVIRWNNPVVDRRQPSTNKHFDPVMQWDPLMLSESVRETIWAPTDDWQIQLARDREARNWNQFHDSRHYRQSIKYRKKPSVLFPGFVSWQADFGNDGER